MIRSPRRRRIAAATLAAIAIAASQFATSASAVSRTDGQAVAPVPGTSVPFYAINRERVPVPADVMPWDPNWAPDGKHIIFQDYNGGYEWSANADGSDVSCITCGMVDHPKIIGGFTYVFPDNRRMLLANELGNSVYILECAPSLFACATHEWLPVNLSGDTASGQLTLARRTYHLAPDGVHIGYTIGRLNGTLMIVGALSRTATGYQVIDQRVVNPQGPQSATDTNAQRWSNGGQIFELKSFADGGRSVIIAGEPNGTVAQQGEVNLATGAVTWRTAYPDWNEDGAPSPDNGLGVVASWRTQNRQTALGLMPLAQSFISMDPVAAMSAHYVSSLTGFSCDIQPWLIPGTGDNQGRLIGQPLNPYGGGSEIAANNLEGQAQWSPDSTSVLLQGRSLIPAATTANSYEQQKGTAPNALLIARIARAASKPIPAMTTTVGAWAPTPTTYKSNFDYPGTHLILGPKGGYALLTIAGTLMGGSGNVTYVKYSQNGRYFLSGTQNFSGSIVGATTFSDDLTATNAIGHRIGYRKAMVTVAKAVGTPPPGQPGTTMTASVDTQWLGQSAHGLPPVTTCTDTMPRATPLVASTSGLGGQVVVVRVTATITGDKRPVQGAIVSRGQATATTNAQGIAVLYGGGKNTSIHVSAGDTFTSTDIGTPGSANGDARAQ